MTLRQRIKRMLTAFLVLTLLLGTSGCNDTDNEAITSDTDTAAEEEINMNQAEISSAETLYHILVLGQSLSMGYATESCLPDIGCENAYMFGRVRTQDLGYVFGITKEEYAADPDRWESEFYAELKPLRETGGDGNAAHQWESASWNEYETPCSGIILGLNNAYRAAGMDGTPYKTLISAPGIGGTPIESYTPGNPIYERAKKDIENGKRLASEKGWAYEVLAIVWLQGENNYLTDMAEYRSSLLTVRQDYIDMIRSLTGQSGEIPFLSYQTMAQNNYYGHGTQNPALAQMAAASEAQNDIYIGAPCYQLAMASDKVHLTNTASRDLGILLGHELYRVLQGDNRLFTPSQTILNGNTATLSFDLDIALDADGVPSSHKLSTIKENGGFFCYDAEGNTLSVTLTLDKSMRELTIEADGDIALIAYGFDPYAKKNQVFTYGGILRRADSVEGSTGSIGAYMPVQLIFGEIPEEPPKQLPDTIAGRSELLLSEENPVGAGCKDPDIMRDGIIPKASESHSEVQYDTYVGRADDHEEYFGYMFDIPYSVSALIFTDGAHFSNGGWFKDGSLRVEVYRNGEWTNAPFTASPEYPNSDSMGKFKSNYRTYTLTLSEPVTCDGIRIIGMAGGDQHFTSISELQVEGSTVS